MHVLFSVQLKMVEGETEVTGNVTNSVVMECPAEGYPLNVTWFRVNRNGQEVELSKYTLFFRIILKSLLKIIKSGFFLLKTPLFRSTICSSSSLETQG